MNKLPTEIVSTILNHLPDESLKCAMEVHPFWRSIINSTIGIKMNIGTDSTFTRFGVQWSDQQNITKLGVRSCYVGQLLDYTATSFAYPQVLKNLTLEGTISQLSFDTMVEPLTVLSHLSIHFSALCGINISPSILSAGVLQTLNIYSHKVTLVYLHQEAVDCLNNCSVLLNSIMSSRFQQLILDLPFVQHLEESIFHCITSCVSRHSRTLKTFQLNWTTSFAGSTDESLIKFNSKIKWPIYEGTHIKRFCFTGCRSMKSYDEWEKFICYQRNLQEFYLNEIVGTFNLNSIFSSNNSTLNKIFIHIIPFNEETRLKTLNCEILRNCSSLTHLIIRGRNSNHQEPNFNGNHILITNAHLLPKTIQVLSIQGIHIQNNDMIIIATELQQLRKLKIIHAGTSGNLGLTPCCFWEILKRRIMHHIEIIGSFNEAMFSSLEGLCFREYVTIKEACRTGQCNIELQDGNYRETTRDMFAYPIIHGTLQINEECDILFR